MAANVNRAVTNLVVRDDREVAHDDLATINRGLGILRHKHDRLVGIGIDLPTKRVNLLNDVVAIEALRKLGLKSFGVDEL